jgi:ATP-dependent exoDNAse (exonuclease V) alpha subunit
VAIYHLSVKNVSRADNRSAVAAAAYRAGARLRNDAEDRISDFSNRSGVVHSEILLPGNAPAWMADREALWNAVEAVEARKDARLAKEVEIALPVELAREVNIGLARRFAADLFTTKGLVADLSVHDAGDGNPHAHILLATRNLAPDGFGAKNRQLDNRAFLSGLRETWEVYANRALEQYGAAARIDHRTLEAQGIDRPPEEHRGPVWRGETEGPPASRRGRDV